MQGTGAIGIAANVVNKTREEAHVMVRLPEGMKRGDLVPFILVAYLIVFILVPLWWLLSTIPEEMRSSLFWAIFASAFGALFALFVLIVQMWWNWEDKTAIMNKMDKNHRELKGGLDKINDTLLRIKDQRGADITSSRPWFVLPADPKPDITSRTPVK